MYDARTSLQKNLEAYSDIIELAESLGDHATGEILREQLVEWEGYTHKTDNFLARDSLIL